MYKGKFNSAVTVGGKSACSRADSVIIGGGAPCAIQTMWKEPLNSADAVEAALPRIENLRRIGCTLLRFAVPTLDDADMLGALSKKTPMSLVADIHFDYKIALRCLDYPIAKLRINPGNIGGEEKVRAVLEKAADKNCPVRIGVNAGSLPKDIQSRLEEGGLTAEEALVETAERELAVFDAHNFYNVVVSLKASSVDDNVNAARLFRRRHNEIPLHIGVTEAGPLVAGIVRSTAALSELLKEGIGDTLRVSLSSSMENEVFAAREILNIFSDNKGIRIVSCPRCARASFDTHAWTEKWQTRLYASQKNAQIAVMGCVVNGPGEARHSDLGISGAGRYTVIFRRGEKVRTVPLEEADAAFEEELGKLE